MRYSRLDIHIGNRSHKDQSQEEKKTTKQNCFHDAKFTLEIPIILRFQLLINIQDQMNKSN